MTHRLSDRLSAALNGGPAEPPLRASAPKVSFLPDEAETEIRRSVSRHYQQVSEIETLKTDIEHWRNRAQLAESEMERLADKLKNAEFQVDELKRGVASLHTQFTNGAQIWITGYRTLRDLNQNQPLAPQVESDIAAAVPALEALKA
jgi:hypothetical protein